MEKIDNSSYQKSFETKMEIARFYNVSRQSVYDFDNWYKMLRGKHDTPNKHQQKQTDFELHELILAIKLSCKSTSSEISEVLKLLEYKHTSIGFVSETLKKYARFAFDDIPVTKNKTSILADEIFIGKTPILVIIDATSHMVLAIQITKNRTGETWKECFNSLIEKGYQLNVVAKDLGNGLAKGLDLLNEKEQIEVIHQADLFHLIMRFRALVVSYTNSAYASIAEEDKQLKILNNRKSQEAIDSRINSSLKAIDYCDERVLKFDNFTYLHDELRTAFNPFNTDGTFRTEAMITDDVNTILDLFDETFERKKLGEAVKFLRKNLEQYFPYVHYLEKVVNEFSKKLPSHLIKEVCLGYQKGLKSMAIKGNYQLAKKVRLESEGHLWLAREMCQKRELDLLNQFYKALCKGVRSSSALEAKNSVLRKYFNSSSNQVNQSALNLIAFYMNHKVAVRGKYKGKSPIERHTGIKFEKNFLELLLAA